MSPLKVFKTYYALTKPGIIRGNAVTATAGFFLASATHHTNGWLLVTLLLGMSLVIASACVFNNYIDRDIDAIMARTKQRALPLGIIPGRSALIYATVLGVTGVLILAAYANFLTVMVGLVGFVVYVVLYGVWKRRSTLGTIIGSVSGAVPPVAGYVTVTNNVDAGAVLLFLILVTWQMPHFYAIAMYRLGDYTAAGVPVLPVKKGLRTTKIQILWYIGAFIAATTSLTVWGYTGYTYLVIALILGLAWLSFGVKGLRTAHDTRWAKQMFLLSLIVMALLSFMIAIGGRLP